MKQRQILLSKQNRAALTAYMEERPENQVAVLLGHESLDTTKIYTRLGQQDLERAVRWAAGDLDEGL